MSIFIEQYEPDVMANGLNSIKNVDFSGATSVALPSGTTIGGSSVVALASISNSITTGAGLSVATSGVYTGTGFVPVTADSATTGSVFTVSAAGLTTGHAATVTAAGTITTTGDALSVIANSATTSTGVVRVSTTALTTGSSMLITGGGANQTSAGKVLELAMGASTVGVGASITTSGTYTGSGILQLSATGTTSGTIQKITAAAATLTTGFYLAANDGALNVLTIGSNGHITSNQTTAPTVATNATGLSAVAVTAGSTDVCGTITSTGTPASGTVITLTFHKTYTTAPKVVLYTPANAAAGGVNTMPIVTQTATTAVFTWPAGGVYAATPSWTYLVIA